MYVCMYVCMYVGEALGTRLSLALVGCEMITNQLGAL